MKKFTFLFLSIILSVVAYGQDYAIAGGDFENWTTFTDNLNSYGLKDYATQGVGKGYNGSNSLNIKGTPTGNDYVFTAYPPSSFPTGTITAITFMVKGTSDAKSLSVNLYKDASNYYRFNVGTLSSSDVIISSSDANDYVGTIDTDGNWVKVTLNLTSIKDYNKTAGVNFLALKIGKETNVDLDIDNLEFVVQATGTETLSSTPTSLNFTANSGDSSDAQTVTVTGANLTTTPTYTITGNDAAMFSVTGDLTTNGGELSVVFSPTSEGDKSASIDIVSGTATTSVTLTGTASAANVSQQTFTFKSGLEPWTAYSVTGDDQVWGSDSQYGAKMNGYSGGAVENQDWLISPVLDLSETNLESAHMTFDHAINYGTVDNFTTNNTLWISSNYTSGNPTSATWTQLTIPTYPSSVSWNFVNAGTISAPSAFLGESNVHVAFKYLSSSSVANTWEITDLVLTTTSTTANVENVNSYKLIVYSTNGSVKFNTTAGNDVEIFSTIGQKLYTGKTIEGKNSISINAKGVLIVKVGNQIGKVIL